MIRADSRHLAAGEAEAARWAFAARLLRAGELPDDVIDAVRAEFRMSRSAAGRLVSALRRRGYHRG